MSRPHDEAKARRLIAYVERYQAEYRCAPVLEEIALELGVSVPRVHAVVSRLEGAGRLESLWVSGRRSPRSLRVVASRQLEIQLVAGGEGSGGK